MKSNSEATLKGKLRSKIQIHKTKDEIYPDSLLSVTEGKSGTFGVNSTWATGFNFLKSTISFSLFVMPSAFQSGGLVFALLGFIAILILVTYNLKRLIISAEYLSKRERIEVRTYDQLAFVSFNSCSDKTRSFAKTVSVIVNILFVLTNLDSICIFMIFSARNLHLVSNFYYPSNGFEIRHYIMIESLIIIILNLVRQLKYIVPFSIIASILLATSVITCIAVYFVGDLEDPMKRNLIGDYSIFRFYSITLFSLSGISIALTLKSSMRKPDHFLSVPGVYCVVLVIMVVFYLPFGFLGYLKFGEETKASVLLNLPRNEEEAIIVRVLAITGAILTSPIIFYVSFNVLWNNYVKVKVSATNELPVEYFTRVSLLCIPFILAISFPTLGPMVVLKGALFHSQLEVVIPPILEFVTFYPEKGHGRMYYRLIKAIFLSAIGIILFLSGTAIGLWDLVTKSDELLYW